MVRRPHNHEKAFEAQHHNFLSVRRLFNDTGLFAGRRLPTWYRDYTNFDHIYHKQDLPDPIPVPEDVVSQRDMGVFTNASWPVVSEQRNNIAQYCGFTNFKEMAAYIDVIYICHEAALLLSGEQHKTNDEAGDDLEFQNFIKKHDFYNVSPHDFPFAKFSKSSPTAVLKAYHSDKGVRDFIDQTVKHCNRPTFLPVQNHHIPSNSFPPPPPNGLHPEAFVLATAVQILLFAPQDWKSDRVYSRDTTQYGHRFPTPGIVGGGTDKIVGGLFPMEDLHRAILMFYALVNRRTLSPQTRNKKGWIDKTPNVVIVEFPGYYDPNTEVGQHVRETQSQTMDGQVDSDSGGNTLDNGIAISAEPIAENDPICSDTEANIQAGNISSGTEANLPSNTDKDFTMGWAACLSTRSDLPQWMAGNAIGEMCLFELVKTTLQ
ncbi:hypothetical protein ACHAPO_010238 [Fusarium lateritium]